MDDPKTAEQITAENDIRAILKMPEGRRFLARLLDITGMRSHAFDPDPHVHAYNEGRRSVGVGIEEDLLLTDPAGYASMLGENLRNYIAANQPSKENKDVVS